jgi:hypothetical protein
LWQAANQYRDKDNIIDAKYDFESGQGGQCRPCFRAGNPFKHDVPLLISNYQKISLIFDGVKHLEAMIYILC